MRNVEPSRDVAVVGRACRLPGASSVDALWDNLVAGRCSVTQVPPDRWSLAKHGHPRPKEPGKSYVWAAGVLDDVWGFDPSVFGISPREAEQMDPQQRLMLELTWEALEDAGIRRSAIAGTDVGVFVGASSTEYQNIRNTDMAGGDAYTATGGALSIVSNRISHAFDFHGPSFTVDTACSSSLVALHQAMEALRSGRIDTAIVGGVNLLLSPFGFVIFSQASMLSPTGLCRTFDAKADGYVRAEGGVVLVLKTAAKAARDEDHVHGRIVASGVNSDGRTNGIALPSRFSQAKLLREVYKGAGIEPSQVAFVEAHGTGTRVGDPIEARTIGDVLGGERTDPLWIGSIKSNIGHLEPASGLAGVLKAMLALEHDTLPPSLHYEDPNPEIPFEELGLAVCTSATALPASDRPRYAGVNSFGFGGTNAHVVVSDAVARPSATRRYGGSSDLFAISAASRPVVRDLARRYSERLSSASFEEAREIVAAAAHRRELLSERAVIQWGSPRDLVRKLERVADKDGDVADVTWGTVTEVDAPVAFVFSGNGSQWPGMGRGAYHSSRRFRETFDEIDALFDVEFGWSVTEALFSNDIEQRLRLTHIAQPLIFATQIGVSRALSAEGLEPVMVLGHSVGEIAAATVAGALSLRDAVRVIHTRSVRQEIVRDTGRMGVVVGTREQVEALCSEVGQLEIAAENSPRTFTVAGPTEKLAALGVLARKRRIVFRQLDLDYPFHCGLIDPVREPLMRDLAGLKARSTKVDMISTVTGDLIEGAELGAEYWWRNVREPVKLSAALMTAARRGARIFVEIGPRSLLLANITETLESGGFPVAAIGVLERRSEPEERDPIRPAVLSAFTLGAPIELEKLFGPEPSRPVSLPTYPWQRRDLRTAETPEAVGFTLDASWHRLAGGRNSSDGVEWLNQLDTLNLPELADHEVGGQAILPGAAFVEMALKAARDWFDRPNAALLELDIVQALPLESDRAKEVKVRLSPATNTLEILSRARLSRAGWHLHATARLSPGTDDEIEATLPVSEDEVVEADGIYRAAEAVGLRYGPAFRLLKSVTRVGEHSLLVDLIPSETMPGYGIDPARLDACFHGLFVLLQDLGAERRGTAYIPVRFGHTRLLRPGAVLARALIEIVRSGEGSIVADFTLFDEAGQAIGHLHEARFQAARVRRPVVLSDTALTTQTVAMDLGSLGLSGVPAKADAILTAARSLVAPTAEGDDRAGDAYLLLEGWAEAAGFEAAHGVASSGQLSRDRLAGLEARAAAWLAHILHALESSGLAEETEEGWQLAAADSLPRADAILRTLAAEHPERSAELLLAGRLTGPVAVSEGLASLSPPPSNIVDGLELGGAAARAAGDMLLRLLDAGGALRGQGLRILQIGYGPLSHALARICTQSQSRLTILELDPRRVERAKLAVHGSDLAFAPSIESLSGSFDLVVSADGLHRFERAGATLAEIRKVTAPDGLLVALEASPSLFRDVVLGLGEGWFETGAGPIPLSPLRSGEEWLREVGAAGFADTATESLPVGSEDAVLLVGAVPPVEAGELGRRTIVIQAEREGAGLGLAVRLDALLALDGHDVRLVGRDQVSAALAIQPGETMLFVASASDEDDVSRLRDGCLALKTCAELCAGGKNELWIVVEADRGRDALADPNAAALLAFSRTLANEYATLVVRRVAIGTTATPERAAEALRALLAVEQTETDIVIGEAGTAAMRVLPLGSERPVGATRAAAAKLERGHAGGLAGLSWQPADPAAPGPGEVQIEVEATGLNFRDVMWAMSLLPDDILEDGYAGATLGLECAGRVSAVGAGVSRFRPGEKVVAFAPSAFSTRVSISQSVVAPVPSGWSTEAAAGIPVAFLTAYYGLVTLGRLKAGEWVLIHGAAGGVGLAALQIARWRGATVVATAGSPEKRDLLRSLGVEHVLNSRSAAFADDIRRLRREGVNIVLNSLSGEAMERGLSTLAPFGRFIELGKRDYVANTQIGLRPFRRNLSYFGVDVDQLLSDQDRASEIFGTIMALFESGEFTPLPYRVFPADETLDAFRLMQQSGHVGKILLRPPAEPVVDRRSEPFRFDPDRTHLVTGGFGGFGLEAARWLADKGARHLVLIGRNGPQSEEAQALVDELVARGVQVRAAACDVADEEALSGLLTEVAADMPPLAGVLHGAMVLDDGLVANLTADQLTRVLRPKVEGAIQLDRLLADTPLDYFVMFSSITTFLGNPGQGAYVAANGYLEGLARLRRERGLPGLALAWGAISDVGVLARQKGLAEALSKRVGVRAMPARDALDLMAKALSETGSDPSRAVLAVGSLDWGAARRLPALGSPTFAALVREGSVGEAAERQSLDLKGLIASQPPEVVRKRVLEAIVEEIATVLRVPKQDVSPNKRLSETGLDSLMAIELATALQDRFELDAPPTGSVAAMTTAALADHMIGFVQAAHPDEEIRVTQALNDRHAGVDLDLEAVSSVAQAVTARSKDLKGLMH
ncbi:SDR family NAD(P)-dependent oxidoreductase [uncultured Enterovirga sp.]|uniref:SDR family NAD(P)-dependent oxidoreductase n=1 Tax=uncultured Enterovirga sp. TaxID=2026352 RepID=UPI0035CB5EF1